MIEIETTGEHESHFYVFEKTGNEWARYRTWDGNGYYGRKDAERAIERLKEDFPEVEFVLFRVTIERED